VSKQSAECVLLYQEMVVDGIKTNIPLHRELMIDAKFNEGGTSIHYLEHLLRRAGASSGRSVRYEILICSVGRHRMVARRIPFKTSLKAPLEALA
jgi:acetyl/propionyl-CoA carboxylase alpha subunit